MHGSPTPNSLHTGQSDISHELSALRGATPARKLFWHAGTHAEVVHAFSQLDRFWQFDPTGQASSAMQQ
jgi:hypothetical protein